MKVKNRWYSTTTAAKVSAVCARCYINGHPHGPATRRYDLPDLHASFQRRRDDHHRTVALGGVPRSSRTCGGPYGLRQDSAGRRLHVGTYQSVPRMPTPSRFRSPIADEAMDAAACIGCGACAATCKNGSAMLFVAARVSSLAKLPQGTRGGCTPRQGDGRQDGRTGLR